jgi:hypothetical protein
MGLRSRSRWSGNILLKPKFFAWLWLQLRVCIHLKYLKPLNLSHQRKVEYKYRYYYFVAIYFKEPSDDQLPRYLKSMIIF